VGDDRHLIGRLDHLGGGRDGGINIAVVTRLCALLVEGLEIFPAELRTVGCAGRPDLPLDRLAGGGLASSATATIGPRTARRTTFSKATIRLSMTGKPAAIQQAFTWSQSYPLRRAPRA
jgi:hypothetical protein